MQEASTIRFWLPGQVMVGAVWSTRVTVKVQLVLLLSASFAVIVTVCVVPAPDNEVPCAGFCEMLGFGSQLSLTVGLKVGNDAVQLASTTRFWLEGQVRLGAVWSSRVTVKVQLAELRGYIPGLYHASLHPGQLHGTADPDPKPGSFQQHDDAWHPDGHHYLDRWLQQQQLLYFHGNGSGYD